MALVTLVVGGIVFPFARIAVQASEGQLLTASLMIGFCFAIWMVKERHRGASKYGKAMKWLVKWTLGIALDLFIVVWVTLVVGGIPFAFLQAAAQASDRQVLAFSFMIGICTAICLERLSGAWD